MGHSYAGYHINFRHLRCCSSVRSVVTFGCMFPVSGKTLERTWIHFRMVLHHRATKYRSLNLLELRIVTSRSLESKSLVHRCCRNVHRNNSGARFVWAYVRLGSWQWVASYLLRLRYNTRHAYINNDTLYTGWPPKSKLYTLLDISTNYEHFFKNSFTVTLSRKFAIKRSLQIPPHLNGVATLPCEILMSENIVYPVYTSTV